MGIVKMSVIPVFSTSVLPNTSVLYIQWTPHNPGTTGPAKIACIKRCPDYPEVLFSEKSQFR